MTDSKNFPCRGDEFVDGFLDFCGETVYHLEQFAVVSRLLWCVFLGSFLLLNFLHVFNVKHELFEAWLELLDLLNDERMRQLEFAFVLQLTRVQLRSTTLHHTH